MPHFFVNSSSKIADNIIIDNKENYKHISRSLRSKIGEKVLLIDENQIQYETKILNIDSDKIICKVEKEYKSKRDLQFDLFLAQSPLRSDAQNLLIEKATELGIRGVYPVITDNCALNKSVIDKKIEKWQKIMYESSKQCERAKIPTCYNVITLENLLQNNFDKILVMAERSTEITLKDFLHINPIKQGDKVLVIIGPEGGFSQKEFDFFKSKHIQLITLGDMILRAETAVVVTFGNILYEFSGR